MMTETVSYSLRMTIGDRAALALLAEVEQRKPADVVRRLVRQAVAQVDRAQKARRPVKGKCDA